MSRNLDRQIGIRVRTPVDDRAIQVAKKFDVPKNEILRRSLEIGLAKLERSNHLLPTVRVGEKSE